MVDWVKDREERETKRHRRALLGLLALVFVYSGVADDTPSAPSAREGAALALQASREEWPLSRRVCRLLLSLLRPVEAATRRLIVILAARLPMMNPRPAGPAGQAARPAQAEQPEQAEQGGGAPIQTQAGDAAGGQAGPAGDADTDPRRDGGTGATAEASSGRRRAAGTAGGGQGKTPGDGQPSPTDTRPPLFSLADPAKRYEWFFSGEPHNAGWQGPPPAGSPYDRLDAAAILRRVAALAGALGDLDAQARRLVRWRSRRIAARQAGKHVSLSPLRVGRPPGSLPLGAPKKAHFEEHDLLAETHTLARRALARLDTS